MAFGPGKYDDICTQAREAAQASAAIVIIVDGNKGPGFSIQGGAVTLDAMPQLLRLIADQMEADMTPRGSA